MPLKVLSVDDSKTIRMIVKKAFKAFDCTISEAENGELGLKAAEKEKPDLIILDITMPVMTGVEMLSKLKENSDLKDIPVIMLTAESGKENVVQIVKMGVKDYMVKPFKGEQLIERVQKLVTLEPKSGKSDKPDGDEVGKYFSVNGDIYLLAAPEKLTGPVSAKIVGVFKTKLEEMEKMGKNKFILDLGNIAESDMTLIKLIVMVTEKCQEAKTHVRVVGTSGIADKLKTFAETSTIPIHASVDAATGTF